MLLHRACRRPESHASTQRTLGLKAAEDGANALLLRPCDCDATRGAAEAHTRPQTGLHVSGIAVRTEHLRAWDRAILICLVIPEQGLHYLSTTYNARGYVPTRAEQKKAVVQTRWRLS